VLIFGLITIVGTGDNGGGALDPCDPTNPIIIANPSAILIQESSTITATVSAADPANCAEGVADGTTVVFSVEGDGTISDVTTTTNGNATATLTAGSTGGTITVTATVTDSKGSSYSSTVDLVVTEKPTITGTAVKGPISGGTVQLFYFDATGGEVEILADNAPVTTDTSGAYSFEIDPANLEGITGPFIVRITDGMTDGQSAPQLEALIADSSTLSQGGSTVTTHLSVASSIAAGLLKKQQALQAGTSPSTADANACIAKVETELDVDLTDDPGTQGTGVAYTNELVDLNLNLPENNNAVDDLIDYLVANLSSTSGALDNSMDDPASPGTDIAAAFSGDLATLLSGGPSDFRILDFEADKTSLGNNGSCPCSFPGRY